MCKLCWALVLALTVGIAAMGYKFIISGATEPGTSGRTAILINAAERDFVLAEMRAFLVSVQSITEGLSTNNMKQVAASASKSGGAATQGTPGSLIGKLPLGFKKLGRDTHQRFDQLAAEASGIGDKEIILKSLGRILQNCTACHASYEFKLE